MRRRSGALVVPDPAANSSTVRVVNGESRQEYGRPKNGPMVLFAIRSIRPIHHVISTYSDTRIAHARFGRGELCASVLARQDHAAATSRDANVALR